MESQGHVKVRKLERRALIRLPAPRRKGNFCERRRATAESVRDAGLLAETDAAAELVEVDAALEVRPVLPGERHAWRQDMARWHYLGDCNLVGESLRYVALVGTRAVARLGWAAAALYKCATVPEQGPPWLVRPPIAMPLSRVRLEFGGVALELDEVVEGIDLAQLCGVDQAHEQVAHRGAVFGLVEERIVAM